jgi:DNA-binding CsgD family transcriptional regulator
MDNKEFIKKAKVTKRAKYVMLKKIGLTCQEIAKLMEVNHGTVWNKINSKDGMSKETEDGLFTLECELLVSE